MMDELKRTYRKCKENYFPIPICILDGIYDSQQLSFFSLDISYQNFWQHNQFILEGKKSLYTSVIDAITTSYEQKVLQDEKQK